MYLYQAYPASNKKFKMLVSNSAICVFATLPMRVISKENFASLGTANLFLKSYDVQKANKKSQKLLTFCKIVKNIDMYLNLHGLPDRTRTNVAVPVLWSKY